MYGGCLVATIIAYPGTLARKEEGMPRLVISILFLHTFELLSIARKPDVTRRLPRISSESRE
jgi:hypothetical protein